MPHAKRNTQAPKKKPRRHSAVKARHARSPSRLSTKLGEFWKTEIAGLSERRFKTLPEAVEAIVERAMKRQPHTEHPGEREFLIEFLLNDAALCQKLQEALRIG